MSQISDEYRGIEEPNININAIIDGLLDFCDHYRILNDKGKEDFKHYINFAICTMGIKENQIDQRFIKLSDPPIR